LVDLFEMCDDAPTYKTLKKSVQSIYCSG